MDEFLIESLIEDKPLKPKKSKGFGFQSEPETVDAIEEDKEENEEVIAVGELEAPVESQSAVKRHDHSIRPMRRTKPVPKRGEKSATQVRR